MELTREALNLYRQQVQRRGGEWPRFNWFINMVHSLLDQNYSGDINIVPHFRLTDLTKVLSHITEDEMMMLMKEGEAATWPEMRAIETCTRISRTLDDILERFERGDLKPLRAARRRPKRPVTKKAAVAEGFVKSNGKGRGSKTPAKKPQARVARVA